MVEAVIVFVTSSYQPAIIVEETLSAINTKGQYKVGYSSFSSVG